MTRIIKRGKLCRKLDGGKELWVVPYIGAVRGETGMCCGLGYDYEDGSPGEFYAAFEGDVPVIQLWQALELFQYVPDLDNGILGECVERLDRDFVNWRYVFVHAPIPWWVSDEFLASAAEVMAYSVPSDEELEQLLRTLAAHGLSPSLEELTRYLCRGAIRRLPIIDELLSKTSEACARAADYEAFLTAPLTDQANSLSKLLQSWGFNDLTGRFWNCQSVTELDTCIKRTTTGKHGAGWWYPLYYEPRPSPSLWVRLSGRIGKHLFAPRIADGVCIDCSNCVARFTLRHAAYLDGTIAVRTLIEQPRYHRIDQVYTVQELAALLGNNPLLPKLGLLSWLKWRAELWYEDHLDTVVPH